jgi:7,8-dihydropterin-6-yl-methyl-4-(beta-D-ribofuranosyl)aminobenzene 5'-phosphate synthase
MAPYRSASTLNGGVGFDMLVAEHGFSALVEFVRDGKEHRVLFDSGVTPGGMVEDMRRLELDAHDIESIVLSHGHFDHATGMDGLIRELGSANLPVLIHPNFWNRRRVLLPGREPWELFATSRLALEGAGLEVIEERNPSFLLHNSLLVTGEVDRTTTFESGLPGHQAYLGGEWQPDPLILDDQALLLNVRDRGLVVLTGCGHSGIINIVRYAKKITGIDQIYAIVGGFHLGGPAFEPIIPQVRLALAELAPSVLVPTHCTGWRAVHALAGAFPDAFVQSSVGTRFEL